MDGEPDVPDEPPEPTQETCEVTATVPVIHYGDEGMWVKVMQVLLISRGFSCGRYGADGEYGMDTKIAVYQFRKAKDLSTNIFDCDAEMWQLLMR